MQTDFQRRTDEPGIFAIGDVAGEPMLAHKASHEARVAVEAITRLSRSRAPEGPVPSSTNVNRRYERGIAAVGPAHEDAHEVAARGRSDEHARGVGQPAIP